MNTLIILFAAALIGFNIWNAINLKTIIKKPLRNSDSLNDNKYWELKYKMQYMITVFSIILFVAAYFGFTSLQSVKTNLKTEIQASLDSTNRILENIEQKQLELNIKVATTDSSILEAENAILGLMGREKALSGSLSMSDFSLTKLMQRISELNSKNIIQQNIYIVDNVEYSFDTYWEFKKYYFKDLKSNTGQPLPAFKKPPFIFSVSNQGFTFALRKITSESFEMSASNASDPDLNNINKFKATLFITENP